jgi:hypothetical protein
MECVCVEYDNVGRSGLIIRRRRPDEYSPIMSTHAGGQVNGLNSVNIMCNRKTRDFLLRRSREGEEGKKGEVKMLCGKRVS